MVRSTGDWLPLASSVEETVDLRIITLYKRLETTLGLIWVVTFRHWSVMRRTWCAYYTGTVLKRFVYRVE
jgi:hypothetical protein